MTQITKIQDERRDTTTNFTDIKRIVRESFEKKRDYEQRYANKLDILDEMTNSEKDTNYQS